MAWGSLILLEKVWQSFFQKDEAKFSSKGNFDTSISPLAKDQRGEPS